MGAAAYNRGSKAIREDIALEYAGRGLGSLNGSAIHPPSVPDSAPKTVPFQVGEVVYCRVTQLRGWPETITAINGNRIKVTGSRAWCPSYNFQREKT